MRAKIGQVYCSLNDVKLARHMTDFDLTVFVAEISKKSRSLFLELDANASKAPQLTPISTPKIDVKKVREVSSNFRPTSVPCTNVTCYTAHPNLKSRCALLNNGAFVL
jgi:hypothetical protein